jgi:uncharacterized membrane protein required for colicin V production
MNKKLESPQRFVAFLLSFLRGVPFHVINLVLFHRYVNATIFGTD